MKNVLLATLILLMFLSLAGCGANPPGSEPADLSQLESDRSDAISSTPISAAESTPVPTLEPTPAATPEPVSVYQDEKVIIRYSHVSSKGVIFEVENLTNTNLTIQADSISINKKSINDITMSENVAPQSIGDVLARCDVDPSTEVATISGQLRIIDFNNILKAYDACFSNVLIDDRVEIPEQTSSNAILFEDDKVVIRFSRLSDKGVIFEVENLTDVNITIQADSISINKKSINDIIMSDDVAPQSIGDIIARCDIDPSVLVETVGGQLRIIDFNKGFKTYDVSFINIPV